VRFFHWTLVLSFIVAYITEEDFLGLHTGAGYIILGLLMVRIIWGFIGSRYARFSDFVFSPTTVLSYLKQTLLFRAKRYIGHNPAGGAMIVLLLASLIITTLSGIAVYGAEDTGPLALWLGQAGDFTHDVLEEGHEFFANFTVFLVVIHIGGVIFESLVHRENLVDSMITGYKMVENSKNRG
jgi:cytochrome b